MKNLNKKIGAMALAAMVLAGGVMASGVSAHASDFENRYPGIELGFGRYVLSKEDESKIKQVEKIVSENPKNSKGKDIILLDVSKFEDKMRKMLKEYHRLQNADMLLSRAKNLNSEEVFKLYLKGSESGYYVFNYGGIYYLFLISK